GGAVPATGERGDRARHRGRRREGPAVPADHRHRRVPRRPSPRRVADATAARQAFGSIVPPDHLGTITGAGGSRPTGTSAPEGVLDLRTALLDVALGPVAAAPGPQPPVAGEAAEGYLGGAFDRFGPVCDRLGGT